MTSKLKFDPSAAFDKANELAQMQESQARLLLWDKVSEKAAENEQFRQQLAQNPENVIKQEARGLTDEKGQSLEVSKNTVNHVAEKARKIYSMAIPNIGQDRVENLIFGTIEDMRTSFKLTLRLSQVLFYSGLSMVIIAFIVGLAGGEKTITLLFGAGGLASVLVSSLVLSPINRVQNAAGDLIQLQIAYLAYYKQLHLLGGDGTPLSKEDAIAYAREIDRAAISLITLVQSKIENENTSGTPALSPKQSEESSE